MIIELSERGVVGASAELVLTGESARKAVAESKRALRGAMSLPAREQARFPTLMNDIVSIVPVVVGAEQQRWVWIDEVRYCDLAGLKAKPNPA